MEEFKKRKKSIITKTISAFIALLLIIIFLFRDEISQSIKEWKASKPGWEETESLGEIDISEEENLSQEPEVEPEKFKDSLGIEYDEYSYTTNKYTFIAPVDWTVTENNGMIVARYEGDNEKYKYKNIDIFIVPCGDFRNEEYPTTYKIRNTGFAIARDRIEYKLDGALYNIFDNETKEDIEMENETILFQSYKITMTRKDGRAGSITPASAVYYKFIDTTGYGIFVFGPEDQELAVDEIAKSVINNFKENIPEEIDVTNYIFPQFKNEVYLDKSYYPTFRFFVPDGCREIINNGSISVFKLTNNISSPLYDCVCSIGIVPHSDSKEVDEYDNFNKYVFCYGNYDITDGSTLLSKIENGKATFEYNKLSHKNAYKDNNLGFYNSYIVNCSAQGHYNYIQLDNFPVKNLQYCFPMNDYSDFVVNITCNSYNEKLAFEYLTKLVESIKY